MKYQNKVVSPKIIIAFSFSFLFAMASFSFVNSNLRAVEDVRFYSPHGVAVDSSGNVYVADYDNNRIQKFTNISTFITKWGSKGTGDGQFDLPSDVAVNSGNVYVVDSRNNRIQVFTTDGNFITKWGSNGTGDGQFQYAITSIAADSSGNVYVVDSGNNRIQVFKLANPCPVGKPQIAPGVCFITKWGSKGTGDGQFNSPYGVAVDSLGNVYVSDSGNHRIQKFQNDGTFITKWGSPGGGNGQFFSIAGIDIDSSGNVYVADSSRSSIQVFKLANPCPVGKPQIAPGVCFITKWGSGGTGDGQFEWPIGVAVDSWGNVYVADAMIGRIAVFTNTGSFIRNWGTLGTSGFAYPTGIAVSRFDDDDVHVVDAENNLIQKFMINGTFITKWGSKGTGDGQFDSPIALAVDSGNLYVADLVNNRIDVFTTDGNFIRKWGSLCNLQNGTGCIDTDGAGPLSRGDGQFQDPIDVTSDSGKVYVADRLNNRIQVFTTDGNFIRKWGSLCNLQNGAGCIDTDGAGPLSPGDGQFNDPHAVAVDSAGNVYVADAGNNRIQKFQNDGTFITKWGSFCSKDSGTGCVDQDGTGSLSVGDGQFSFPRDVAVDSSGNVYVVDSLNHRIQEFMNNGTFIRKWGSLCNLGNGFGCIDPDGPGPLSVGDGQFSEPLSLAVDFIDNVYVADTGNNRIQKFQNDGTFIRKWGSFDHL